MENSKTLNLKSGLGIYFLEVVIHERFDWENFGVFAKWSRMGGGRLRQVVAHEVSTVIIGVIMNVFFA